MISACFCFYFFIFWQNDYKSNFTASELNILVDKHEKVVAVLKYTNANEDKYENEIKYLVEENERLSIKIKTVKIAFTEKG